MKVSRVADLFTAVSFQGPWVKVLQAGRAPEGGKAGTARLSLLAMKARRIEGLPEPKVADELRELLKALPVPAKELFALLPTGEVLTRYLTLPSEDPAELRAMARYQLEGLLPFPAQECVIAVKVLGPAGEATRVLAAAAHRPVIDRLLRICRAAGVELSGIAATSEALGSWHRACWPMTGKSVPKVWLVAERTSEGLELGVLVQGSLVYMRQAPGVWMDRESLEDLLRQTLQAYSREQAGPAVEQVTLSGSWEGLGADLSGWLEAELGLSVSLLDPLERSPFGESLATTAQELAAEVSFSELLGAACQPQLLQLDLLPEENRTRRAQAIVRGELRRTAALFLLALVLVAGWAATRSGSTWWLLRQGEKEAALLKPGVDRIQKMVSSVRWVAAARAEFANQMICLASCTQRLESGMTLQFLGFEAGRAFVVRGTAPDLKAVTRYAVALRQEPLWQEVSLRSAKAQLRGKVEFELVLKPKAKGQGGP